MIPWMLRGLLRVAHYKGCEEHDDCHYISALFKEHPKTRDASDLRPKPYCPSEEVGHQGELRTRGDVFRQNLNCLKWLSIPCLPRRLSPERVILDLVIVLKTMN